MAQLKPKAKENKITPIKPTSNIELTKIDPSKPWEQNMLGPSQIREFMSARPGKNTIPTAEEVDEFGRQLMTDERVMQIGDPNIETMSQAKPKRIPMNRKRFLEVVYKQLGGNPHIVNIVDETNKIFQRDLPTLWNHVFDGKIPWGGRLNDDQLKFWNTEKQEMYNDIFNSLTAENDQKKDALKHAMGEFEARKAEQDALKKEPKDVRTASQKEFDRFKKNNPSWKGSFLDWKKQIAEAGATTIDMRTEKFGLEKEITINEIRKNLVDNKDDKNFYQANAPLFNKKNTNNEVAYWGIEKGRIYDDEKIMIIKLPKVFLDDGITPSEIQRAANATGKTVKQVLKDFAIKYKINLGLTE